MNNIITGKLYKRTNLKDGDGLYLPNYKILVDNIPLIREDVPSKIKEYIDKIPPENKLIKENIDQILFILFNDTTIELKDQSVIINILIDIEMPVSKKLRYIRQLIDVSYCDIDIDVSSSFESMSELINDYKELQEIRIETDWFYKMKFIQNQLNYYINSNASGSLAFFPTKSIEDWVYRNFLRLNQLLKLWGT